MPSSPLSDFQDKYPAATAVIEGAGWAWRDTDPGSGRPPLVFLPGASGTGDVFYLAVRAIAVSRRAITLRYPALSEMTSIVSGVGALLTHLGLDRVDIAASSLGGYVAQALAIERPARLRKVLLGNTFFDPSWLQARMSRDAVLATSPDDHLAQTITRLSGLPEATAHQIELKSTMLALVGTQQTSAMARAALAALLGSEPLRTIDLPSAAIAILDTEDDPVVDASTRSAVRERYFKSRSITFEFGGHYPSLLNPDAYNDALQVHFGDESL